MPRDIAWGALTEGDYTGVSYIHFITMERRCEERIAAHKLKMANRFAHILHKRECLFLLTSYTESDLAGILLWCVDTGVTVNMRNITGAPLNAVALVELSICKCHVEELYLHLHVREGVRFICDRMTTGLIYTTMRVMGTHYFQNADEIVHTLVVQGLWQ